MTEESKEDRVKSVVDRLYGGPALNALAPPRAQLDISRPNIHDSKAEFLREKAAVQLALKGSDDILGAFLSQSSEDQSDRKIIFERLIEVIDRRARNEFAGRKPKTASDLAELNVIQDGLTLNTLKMIIQLRSGLRERIFDLDEQELEFWSVKHRPANYYARAIASRLARLYFVATGNRPTYGTSSDGGHPSTDFGRALEEIFEILEIKASVRTSAKWAVENLSTSGFEPESRTTIRNLLTLAGDGDPENAYLTLKGAFKKGTPQ